MPNIIISNKEVPDVNVPQATNVGFPEAMDEPTIEVGMKQVTCPKCGKVYQIPVYLVDVECRSSSDGTGCEGNDYKYWDDATNGYVSGYWPFVFDVDGGENNG